MSSSLRIRIVAGLALAAVIPTVIVGVLAITRAQRDVEREVQRGALSHIRALGAALDGTLQDSRRTIELAAATWADAMDDQRATQLLLARLRRDVPIIHAVSLVDPDGKVLAGDPAIPIGLDIGQHSFGGYIGDARFMSPDDGDTSHGYAQSITGRPSVRIVVQARGRTGELMGVVIASLDLGFVREVIAAARLGPGARVLVVDGAGVPVATSDDAMPPESLAGRDPAVDRALASTVEGTLVQGGWVAAYRNLSSYQSQRGVRWAILHEQPERDAYALARRTTRDTAIVGTLALAVAIALGAWFATRLTRPLETLARRADAIAAGSADAPPAVEGPGEVGVLGQRIDEMARRIAERTELQQALARGDRLASVGVMSAQVAHEINNPLTTVLGYAKLLLEDKPEGHPDRAGLELIAEEAERMKKIIGGLLEYARSPRESARAFSAAATSTDDAEPSKVIAHVAALLAPQLKRARATVTTDVTTKERLTIEPNALQQVLVNIVQNAAQAMTEPGTIAIATRSGIGGIATVITITDDGPGIPAANRAKVFDPFFTTKAAGVGTGLGLAVSKHLVATVGGSIEVGDNPNGRGAEFRVVIPNAERSGSVQAP